MHSPPCCTGQFSNWRCGIANIPTVTRIAGRERQAIGAAERRRHRERSAQPAEALPVRGLLEVSCSSTGLPPARGSRCRRARRPAGCRVRHTVTMPTGLTVAAAITCSSENAAPGIAQHLLQIWPARLDPPASRAPSAEQRGQNSLRWCKRPHRCWGSRC